MILPCYWHSNYHYGVATMLNKVILIIAILSVSACTATPYSYMPNPETDKMTAVKVIEQVIYEQHEKYRPESVFISDDFIAISKGTLTKSRAKGVGIAVTDNVVVGLGSTKTLIKGLNQRIYFNSLGQPKLYTKRGRYIAQINNESGRALLNVAVDNELKAKKFIDSIMYFVINAKKF